MSHTYVIVNVSPSTYDEIHRALEIANYQHAFHVDFVEEEVIDLHGLALKKVDEEEEDGVTEPWACPECPPYIVVNQGRVACARCGADAPDRLADEGELP